MNDGTCDDSCMEGSGYKCVCTDGRMGDNCQNWTSKWEKFQLSFSNGLVDTGQLKSQITFLISNSALVVVGGGGGGGVEKEPTRAEPLHMARP